MEATEALDQTQAERDAERARAERGDYIAGLRKLADVLEEHPVLPLPTLKSVSARVGGERFEEIAKAMPIAGGQRKRDVTEWTAEVKIEWDGLTYSVSTERDNVCEKKVVGKRTVVKREEVYHPPTLGPEVEVEEEIVEWECPEYLKGPSGGPGAEPLDTAESVQADAE